MLHKVKLQVGTDTGSLQRVLVTLTRRGFDPLRIDARLNGPAFDVELHVDGARPATLLARQLGRLFDVKEVEVMPSLEVGDVEAAEKRIRPLLTPTPAVWSDRHNAWLKLENLQVTGAFKVRGALNALGNGDPRPVVAASAGNHALGVAWAARHYGLEAHVVVPVSAPHTKVEGCRELGAHVLERGIDFDEAYRYARDLAVKNNWRFVHAFDDADVIAGQGTIALELLELKPDVVVMPIGGGSLAAGMGLVLKAHGVRTVGVQVEGVDAMVRALGGDDKPFEPNATVADGLRVRRAGELTRRVCGEVLDEVVTITEEDLRRTMVDLVTRDRLTAEGAGAAAVCALPHVRGKRKVAVVSGGNIDEGILFDLFSRRRRCEPARLPA